jgi:hypothetical protein
MGWKNVKEHYRIDHLVHVRNSKICIGSAYIPDIIIIGSDGTIEKRDADRWSVNRDLDRYQKEMDADPAKLKQLVESPDTFTNSITVYTYGDGQIIEKQCEVTGWPNVTHDGELMYDNTFCVARDVVLKWALRDAEAYLKRTIELITERSYALTEAINWREQAEGYLENLKELANVESK